MASKLYRTEAIVLKSAPLGEGHLLVTLLDRDGSKLRAVAWGGRKLTSRKMGHLEPLTRVDLALSRGRADLDGVSQAQGLESFGALKSDLEATAKAIYLAELVDGFASEGSDNPPLYDLFLNTLRMLQESPDTEVAVPYFQLNLLNVSGFMPELYRCVECRQRVSPGDHQFSVDLGGALCGRCVPLGARISPLSLQAMKVLRYFDRSGHPDMAGLRVSGLLYQEVRSILDAATRYWLDRDVHSRDFMDHVERKAAKHLSLRG